MKPILYEGSSDDAALRLESLISTYGNAKLVERDGSYFHYEFTTKIGKFVDDVEFLVNDIEKIIEFRSASREGYGDMGKNRRRMRKIRRKWRKGK